jgi:AcrR family transcriptional regulator
MRADAQRNRERLLEVAVELVLEAGGEPTRDVVAQRAGVGIATLYRHFPDQQALLLAAARHALERSIAAGEELVETVPDGVDALRAYMHAALDNGIGAVNIIRPLLHKRRWPDLQARAETLMKKLVEGVTPHSALGDHISTQDIVFALTRFARPLAMGMSAHEERALAHRHLDFYIDGLCFGQPPFAPRRSLADRTKIS